MLERNIRALQRRRQSEEQKATLEERVAVFMDEHGKVYAVSAVCAHLSCALGWNPVSCALGWNPAGRTWDCSCHGSRSAIDGRVLHGPATAPLESRSVTGA
jgi:Rieske Fe-S protein